MDWKGVDFRLDDLVTEPVERDDNGVREDEDPRSERGVNAEDTERGGELGSEVGREVKSEEASISTESSSSRSVGISLAPAKGIVLSSSFSLSSLSSSFEALIA